MGIDTKEIGSIVWKILGSSMITSFNFMRNHPILSGVSMFLLTLYIFVPFLFFFLIYTSPILSSALVYARENLELRFSDSGTKTCGGENNGGRCHLRHQQSVRRNARMKVEEWDSHTSEEEKDKVILTSLYNDLLGRTPQFEESPKAVEDTEKASSLGDVIGEKPMVCNCEINEEKHEGLDGKEETSEEMNCTYEYEISEIERHRRLESLIARRRARRLFRLALKQRNKLQADETSSLTQNNSLQITVPKKNEKGRNHHLSGLQIPGSAPSVMSRNPFDIPYDPQEERPNLTGDSFDEEFSFFNNHKDMLFTRHESFCRFSLFSPHHALCMNSPVPASDMSNARRHLDLENEYMVHSEQKLPKEATIKDDDQSIESEESREREVEINDETDSDKEGGVDSSGSDESESEVDRLNKVKLREAIRNSMDNYVNQETRKSIPSTFPRGLVGPRVDDNSMFYPRRCSDSHSRTFSVASDMQVEVSELGSPPTTVDWLDDWSNGGESYMYDTDPEREINLNEDLHKKVSSSDDMSRSEIYENFEKKPSSSSGVSKPTSSGKGLLFRTSVSLASITEEPETISDLIDEGNSENRTDHRSLTSLDSSMKLIDKDDADVKQLENEALCEAPLLIESNITDQQDLNNVQEEHDTEAIEKTNPGEYEVNRSFLDASLDTPYIEPFEREVEEPSQPHTQLLEDYGNAENASDLILLQAQEDNNSTLDNSTDQEICKEVENRGLSNDFIAESTKESDHEDIAKDEFAAVAKDSAVSESNDEEILKLDEQVEEAVEKELDVNLESTHHNIGLVTKENEEESKNIIGEIDNAEAETKS